MANIFKRKLAEEIIQQTCRDCGEAWPEDDFTLDTESYIDIDYLDSFVDAATDYTFVNVNSAQRSAAYVYICPDGCKTTSEPESFTPEDEDTAAWVCAKCGEEYGFPNSWPDSDEAEGVAATCCRSDEDMS